MAIEYNIKVIPTVYGGIRFRSKLEATWAAFFDILELTWNYETLTLEGWEPDFWVNFGQNRNIYWRPFENLDTTNIPCEVKPISFQATGDLDNKESTASITDEDKRLNQEKVNNAFEKVHFGGLCLGKAPFAHHLGYLKNGKVWKANTNEPKPVQRLVEEINHFKGETEKVWRLKNKDGTDYESDHYGTEAYPVVYNPNYNVNRSTSQNGMNWVDGLYHSEIYGNGFSTSIQKLWNQAANKTQWNP